MNTNAVSAVEYDLLKEQLALVQDPNTAATEAEEALALLRDRISELEEEIKEKKSAEEKLSRATLENQDLQINFGKLQRKYKEVAIKLAVRQEEEPASLLELEYENLKMEKWHITKLKDEEIAALQRNIDELRQVAGRDGSGGDCVEKLAVVQARAMEELQEEKNQYLLAMTDGQEIIKMVQKQLLDRVDETEKLRQNLQSTKTKWIEADLQAAEASKEALKKQDDLTQQLMEVKPMLEQLQQKERLIKYELEQERQVKEQLTQQLEQLHHAEQQIKQELEQSKQGEAEMKHQLNQAEEAAQRIEQELEQERYERQQSLQQLEQLQQAEQQIKQELEQTKQAEVEMKHKLNQAEEAAQRIKESLEQSQKDVQYMNQKLDQNQQVEQKMKQSEQQLKEHLREREEQLATLQQATSRCEAAQGGSHAKEEDLEALLQQTTQQQQRVSELETQVAAMMARYEELLATSLENEKKLEASLARTRADWITANQWGAEMETKALDKEKQLTEVAAKLAEVEKNIEKEESESKEMPTYEISEEVIESAKAMSKEKLLEEMKSVGKEIQRMQVTWTEELEKHKQKYKKAKTHWIEADHQLEMANKQLQQKNKLIQELENKIKLKENEHP